MIVLAVDVGGLLLRRRAMVNGSDAAALAAAKSCALTTDTQIPEFQADLFAADNVVGLTSGQGGIDPARTVNCDTLSQGHVTVEYTTPQNLVWAGVLGFGPTSNVTTDATAEWGPTAAGNPGPIVLNIGDFQGACRIPTQDATGGPLDIGDTCYFWYDNDRFDGSNFGFMNLDQWDVAATDGCSNAGTSDRTTWIQTGWDGGDQLQLNYPTGPTYVCTDSGISSANWQTLEAEEGETKVFPINDWDGSISGWPELYGGSGQIDKYQIVGFAALQIDQVLTVAEATGPSGSCSGAFDAPTDPNNDGDIVPGQSFSLDSFGAAKSCFAGAPDSIVNVLVKGSHPSVSFTACTGPGVPSPCDYYYDPATRLVTWYGPPTAQAGPLENRDDLQISFDWSNEGVCGPVPGNSSARCLVVSWHGDTLTGTNPCPSCVDFGTRAIKLCDLTIAGSCS
jgi:hypothetical protein